MPNIADAYKTFMRDSIFKALGIENEALYGEVDTPPIPPKVMTPYDVLGVPTSAKADYITVAYRTLLKKHHPDTGDGDVAQLQRVRDAFSLIGNAQKRERYDKAVKLLQKQETPHFESGVFTPPVSYAGVGYRYSSGSAYPSSGQQHNGLRVGYQIPQIGGVVAQVNRIALGATTNINSYKQYDIFIDATFPQWVVHNWTHWQIQLTDSGWWCDVLGLDRRNFTVRTTMIDVNNLTPVYQLGSSPLIAQINSLGAQIELEVIET